MNGFPKGLKFGHVVYRPRVCVYILNGMTLKSKILEAYVRSPESEYKHKYSMVSIKFQIHKLYLYCNTISIVIIVYLDLMRFVWPKKLAKPAMALLAMTLPSIFCLSFSRKTLITAKPF